MQVSDEFGTDALRMGLVIGTTPGTDMNLDPRKVGAYKKFANKLWNVARFVLESTADSDFMDAPLTSYDQDLMNELKAATDDTTANLDNFKFHLAGENLYHFVWHRFADDIIEESKPILKGEDLDEKRSRQRVLYQYLITSLKQLHPFMPFVTEAIWQELPHTDTKLLMVSHWPRV
jgi:valyl-tRNA synthetase